MYRSFVSADNTKIERNRMVEPSASPLTLCQIRNGMIMGICGGPTRASGGDRTGEASRGPGSGARGAGRAPPEPLFQPLPTLLPLTSCLWPCRLSPFSSFCLLPSASFLFLYTAAICPMPPLPYPPASCIPAGRQQEPAGRQARAGLRRTRGAPTSAPARRVLGGPAHRLQAMCGAARR